MMKKLIFSSVTIVLLGTLVTAQVLNKKPAEAPEAEDITALVLQYKKEATQSLEPYRYDNSKITYFLYKPFEQIKEVEVFFFNTSEYRISFNSKAVKDPIVVEIYDKPIDAPNRTLLYKKDGVQGGLFQCTSKELKDKLVEALGKELQLKKVYIDYRIPAKAKETTTDERTGEEFTTRHKAAMVLAMGYSNL
jgi:hypothetical protein